MRRIIQYFDVSLVLLELRLLTSASWYFIHYEIYFHTMLDGYGFVPRVEHNACMLDVLGQAVISKNPKNSLDQLSRTWNELMADYVECRNHRDYEPGAYEGKNVMALDYPEPSVYDVQNLLRANCCGASHGMMKPQRVRKEPEKWLESGLSSKI
ncbi:hypothetical protein Droror1_Dr00009563 [Drosera rotundifolia]